MTTPKDQDMTETTDIVESGVRKPVFFEAYYFELPATGVEVVDLILERLARAGKAFHHTEWWDDPDEGDEDGVSHVDSIGRAAQAAADTITALTARIAELEAERETKCE